MLTLLLTSRGGPLLTTELGSHSRVLCCTPLCAVAFPLSWLCCSIVKVTLRLKVSQSVSLGIVTPWQLRSFFFSGAPSLTRERVCLLYMLLALARVVFLGSESFETRDHIILSQIWDFPFRQYLRLAGSRWRYSNPPPHGCLLLHQTVSHI
jgi:hypothetical protein